MLPELVQMMLTMRMLGWSRDNDTLQQRSKVVLVLLLERKYGVCETSGLYDQL